MTRTERIDELSHCGHGKSYKEPCPECEAVWAKRVTLPNLATSAQRVADFALEHPGLIDRDCAAQIAALSRSVAILAKACAEHNILGAKADNAQDNRQSDDQR